MMEMKLVDVMTELPACCTLCGSAPRDFDGALPAIFVPGLDVNWGDAVYICCECSHLIADLFDRPSSEEVSAVRDGLKLQKMENEKLRERNEELEARVETLTAAKAVRKAVRKEKATK